MVTVLTGGLALFALGIAAVLAIVQARTAAVRMTMAAGALALAFVAFAIIGDRRERHCVDGVPHLQAYELDRGRVHNHNRALATCRSGKTLGLSEPFGSW